MVEKKEDSYILEVKDRETAENLIKYSNYRLERFSETRDCYILIQRTRV